MANLCFNKTEFNSVFFEVYFFKILNFEFYNLKIKNIFKNLVNKLLNLIKTNYYSSSLICNLDETSLLAKIPIAPVVICYSSKMHPTFRRREQIFG
jgi:hypothetical protein